MLIYASRLIGTPILSMQSANRLGVISSIVVDPNTLKIIAFCISGSLADRSANILDVRSIREYSNFGIIIDSSDELITKDDVISISKVISLNFSLPGLKVETKKGTRLGKVIDYTVTDDNFTIQQILVKRPTLKSFLDPELIIPRTEIVEITDYKIIVRDEEKTIRARAEKEDFIPNFVNPFRTPSHAKNQE
ncbi:PRC-barrel domain-containing protein [Candidatus Saccharibacteria bacterium]|nr:PRC-barrel domain-containing protein [Candidatus Saccharibacteria bacterium]